VERNSFCGAASKFICVELQVSYIATEMFKSKLQFECLAADVGVKIHSYHTPDNGSTTQMCFFLKELQAKGQGIKMSVLSNGEAKSRGERPPYCTAVVLCTYDQKKR